MPIRICCFCAEPIRGEVPIEIAVPLPDGGVQALWAHGQCLHARLHQSIPALPTEKPPIETAQLSEQQAYLAMFTFLEGQFASTGSGELGALLGSLSLLPDGGPADPALLGEWKTAVTSVLSGEVNALLNIVGQERPRGL